MIEKLCDCIYRVRTKNRLAKVQWNWPPENFGGRRRPNLEKSKKQTEDFSTVQMSLSLSLFWILNKMLISFGLNWPAALRGFVCRISKEDVWQQANDRRPSKTIFFFLFKKQRNTKTHFVSLIVTSIVCFIMHNGSALARVISFFWGLFCVFYTLHRYRYRRVACFSFAVSRDVVLAPGFPSFKTRICIPKNKEARKGSQKTCRDPLSHIKVVHLNTRSRGKC